jgi:hypothetical protein
MFLEDPFAIGAAEALTDQQKAKAALDKEWDAAGRPTLEERIEARNKFIERRLKRAFEEKK